jgi:hypothetical protein
MSNNASESGQASRPGRLITLLAGLLFSLLLLASLGLGYLGGGSYSDPYAGAAGRCWSVLAMGVAGSLCIASILALRYLIRRKPASGSAAVVLVVVTLVDRHALIFGYRCFSFVRAFGVVKCHSTPI